MPTNGMNTGTDYSLIYYDGNTGALVNLGDVQNVKITALKHDIASKPYNTVPRYAYVGDGFKIDFQITRTGPDLEVFMATAAANFNAGAVQQPGYLQQTITNPDGSITRFQYTKMVIFLTDHGDISRDKPVTLVLEGMASDKVQIA